MTRLWTSDGRPVATVRVADRFWPRLRGLMLRRRVLREEGVLFPRCPSIHTIGMRTAIDLVFVVDGTVVKVVDQAPPNRVFRGPLGADALELAPGRVREIGMQPGDRLVW